MFKNYLGQKLHFLILYSTKIISYNSYMNTNFAYNYSY